MARRDPASLRKHVIELLRGGHAHVTLDDAVKGLSPTLRGKRPRGAQHSVWEIVEHIRLAQRDILDFSRDTGGTHISPEWPSGYWPPEPAPPKRTAWNASLAAIRKDRRAMERLVSNPRADLFAPFPWSDGQTILREALLLADHTSYHTGELLLVRRLLGAWR
jgi:hypothetical protein